MHGVTTPESRAVISFYLFILILGRRDSVAVFGSNSEAILRPIVFQKRVSDGYFHYLFSN